MIVKMKKIKLFAVRSQKEELLSELQLTGCVELSEPETHLKEPEILSMVKREVSDLDRYRAEHQSLVRALELLDQYAPKKSPMFSVRPEITCSKLLDETNMAHWLELAKKLEVYDSQIRRLCAEESRLKSLIESLMPWEPMDLPLDSAGTRYAAAVSGMVPASADLDALDKALENTVQEAQLFRISSSKEQHCLLLICLRDKLPDASDVLRTFSFSLSSLKNLHGTAKQNIRDTEQRLIELSDEKSSISAKIAAESPQREHLKLCADHVNTKIAKAEAAERLLGTESAVSLVGWVPASSEKTLQELFDKYDCAWELEDPAPEETDSVPIFLKNNKLTQPLMMVTEMYSLPSYGGIDPNPLIMPFFSLFFGMMFADMGYGLIMFVLSLLGNKLRARGTLKYMIGLLRLCGITTFIFGALTGSLFGDAVTVIAGMFGHTVALPALFNPLKDPLMVLVGSLIIGFIQIIVGMGISAYMSIRDGRWTDALFDVGSWWLLFAGIALGALGITWWVAIAGVAALVLTQGRSSPSIPGKLIGGIASLYNITGYFGDVLSYSRIMALMLAGSVIASVMNKLGSLPGSIIVFIPIFLVGHVFNMGLNIIGSYVHTSRLQYLEYFGKFYKDGGKPFKPLKINTNYYDIIKEEI
jgi:V/A-type H+-transporting ATPase subunit I